jgi:hypothetical protein
VTLDCPRRDSQSRCKLLVALARGKQAYHFGFSLCER